MPGKILLADDDDEIRELIKFTLESENYTVIEASDGEMALNKVFQEQPDLIILDIMMPKLTGFEVCERLRTNAKTCLIPIILLTSLAQTKDKITGIKLGADEYVTKPFENYELIARIESLLKRHRSNIATSPLTHLSGNVAVENEMKNRFKENSSFALMLIDISHFRVYNDKYSFEAGDDVLKIFGAIVNSARTELGGKDDLAAYLGNDDFVIVTTTERADVMAAKLIQNFEETMPKNYDADVLQRGYIWAKDESGAEKQYPLLTVAIAGVSVEPGIYKHTTQIMNKAKEALAKAKTEKTNAYVKA